MAWRSARTDAVAYTYPAAVPGGMAHIDRLRPDADLTDPTLVEGFPGVGLVGKIAVDHLIDELGMVHHANLHCEGLPRVASYAADTPALRTPVRLYAHDEGNLLALQSDVPVASDAATTVAECLGGLFSDHEVTPVYLSGLPTRNDETEASPAVFGVSTGDGKRLLAGADIDSSDDPGLISGPTGALLNHAVETGETAVGLVVESDARFPDPEASRVLIERGIGPIAGIDVPVKDLVDHADEIRAAKEEFAKRMQAASSESTRAQPLRMYQ